jgi:hypothetical protein
MDTMWLGNADGEYVGVGEDLDAVMDTLKKAFADDKEMPQEQAEERLGQDLKLGDYFVTLDGVRQRAYSAIRVDVIETPEHNPIVVSDYADPEKIAPPSEICDTCSDPEQGFMVPASFCEVAKAKMEPRPWEQ